MTRVINSYRLKWRFPNCAGAIDGTHIPISKPDENHIDYVNRKEGYYSMLMQAVVNDRYAFTGIMICWPCRVHDARVFANSRLYTKGNDGTLFSQRTVHVGQYDIPVVLLGDPAYLLLSWLIKPLSDNGHLRREQQRLYYMLSRSRMPVEKAFGRLKGRWRRVLKPLDMKTEYVGDFVAAFCVLHNMCDREGEPIREEWLVEVRQHANLQPNRVAAQAVLNANDTRAILIEMLNQ